jgi:uncharacterized protein
MARFGSAVQTVWNRLTGREPTYGIKDYDIFYFDDSDLSPEAEDRSILRAMGCLGDLDARIEVRNQARVHLWYTSKFGAPYGPLRSSTNGIDRFLAIACMVGVKPRTAGDLEIYAPRGLEDLARMQVRPNHSPNFRSDRYEAKAARWLQLWPELTVVPA